MSRDGEVSHPGQTVRVSPGDEVTVTWGREMGKGAVLLTFHADGETGDVDVMLTVGGALNLARHLLEAASAL